MSFKVFRTTQVGLAANKELKLQSEENWEDLVLKVASRGCRDSFKKIFNHFYPVIVGQGMKAGLTKELASELAQETMIKVWNQIGTFDASKGNFSLWLYVVARNIRYDYFRKSKGDYPTASSLDIYSDLDPDKNNESDLGTLVDINFLKDHILHLPTEQRDVIEKVYLEGTTHSEYAEQFKIPLGTVKSRLRIAMSTIKESMEKKSK